MNQKYNTLLQMYGEKVEEAEELRLDLEDIKSMYKAQVFSSPNLMQKALSTLKQCPQSNEVGKTHTK